MRKRLLATIILSSLLISSLGGCGRVASNDATKYPLVPALTEQEVIDFYAKSLDYDTVVVKNLDVDKAEYVEREVSDSKKEQLHSLYKKAEVILNQMTYNYTKENQNIVSIDTYNYIKGYLNNYRLDNPEVTSITGALGYYFVDVKYTLGNRTCGTFTQKTHLLGIHGAFVRDIYGNDKIDGTFLSTAVEKLNEYYKTNRITKEIKFDKTTGELTLEDLGDDYYDLIDIEKMNISDSLASKQVPMAGIDDLLSGLGGNTESPDDTESNEDTEVDWGDNDWGLEEDKPSPTPEPVEDDYETFESKARKCEIDVETFNKVVGASYADIAYMPILDEVFNRPTNEGVISGMGIYDAGKNTLGLFGFDNTSIQGEIVLRYVFKDTIDASGDIIGVNIYPKSEKITNGLSTVNDNVLIPDFLRVEFEKLIERADRAEMSMILPSLIGGNIYEDMGNGVLIGYMSRYSYLLKNMSTLRQVLARDTVNNSYLLEIESTRIEGPKDVDAYATYRDKYYIVVQQQADKFVITDKLRVSRKLISEPLINPDDVIAKRLVALNLSGDISDANKTDINKLLSEWYLSGTCRVLRGPKEIQINGKATTLNRGMYDCFNSNPKMLSTDDKEYMNSKVRTQLVKYGTDVPAQFSGIVTEWMGGYDNQAEFTTEEIIVYSGRAEAIYMQVYYLVSNMEDTWVIDERTVLSEKAVSGAELNEIKARIKQ